MTFVGRGCLAWVLALVGGCNQVSGVDDLSFGTGGAGGAGGAGTTGAGGAACVELGRIALFSGKVNTHTNPDAPGEWIVDADCSSGASVDVLTYCQKFWPNTASVVAVASSYDQKPFMTAGCNMLAPEAGDERICCGDGT